jgi:hypothetical protein
MIYVLKQRGEQLRGVAKYWARNDMNSSLNAIAMTKDPSVVVDILSSTFSDNIKVETLSLD